MRRVIVLDFGCGWKKLMGTLMEYPICLGRIAKIGTTVVLLHWGKELKSDMVMKKYNPPRIVWKRTTDFSFGKILYREVALVVGPSWLAVFLGSSDC